MFKRLFIANRGEIAVRIARAAAGLGIASVAAFSEDDAASPHVLAATAGGALPGRGPRAYLDGAAVIAAAKAAGCDALHPGYGFLSENAAFAADCVAAGIVFIGPAPAALDAACDRRTLWRFGISGDRPILLVSVGVPEGLGAVIMDGRVPHCLLLEVFTEAGVGTMVRRT